MIGIVGDVHGRLAGYAAIVAKLAQSGCKHAIQVGDMGFNPGINKGWIKPPIMTYFIDGNHDYFPALLELKEPTEVLPNLTYVPRGTILELDGKKIAFCGGGRSLDVNYRTRDMDWFPDVEYVTDSNVAAFEGKQADLLVSHIPPQFIIKKYVDQMYLDFVGLPREWKDDSADKIHAIWGMLKYPSLYAGHLHQSIKHGKITVLNMMESQIIE